MKSAPDVFSAARETFKISDLWVMLGLSGEPSASCHSPFREDRSPSFSIFDDGRKWHDHATGDGGDVVDFLCKALEINHAEARKWLVEKLNLTPPPARVTIISKPPKQITWPADLVTGDQKTWEAFAAKRQMTIAAVHAAVAGEILRFCRIDGIPCFVISDPDKKCAEIRRIDGQLFKSGSKAYPLRGVDKSFPIASYFLRDVDETFSILITEGCTDFLTSFDMLWRYRHRDGGKRRWLPLGVLGAGINKLDASVMERIKGKTVRMIPDADDAGDRMIAKLGGTLANAGCAVEIVKLPRGTDLTDNRDQIQPGDIYS